MSGIYGKEIPQTYCFHSFMIISDSTFWISFVSLRYMCDPGRIRHSEPSSLYCSATFHAFVGIVGTIKTVFSWLWAYPFQMRGSFPPRKPPIVNLLDGHVLPAIMMIKTGQAIITVISTTLARPTASGQSGQGISCIILRLTLIATAHFATRLISSKNG
jgi:hypothetical protein